jgi:quercetin dioxygenase-like cupin family protein
MSAPDRERIAADWAARGFSCAVWTDAPGQRWEDFRHAEDELVTVLEGDMEFDVAGRLHHPHVGEELLIPAGQTHSARNVGKTTARWLYGYKRPG